MAQPNSGDWPIAASNTTGNDLADKLNRLTAAVYSSFAGTGRPSGSTTGMIWVQTSGSELRINIWNGSSSVRVATASTSNTSMVYNSVYTKTEVDNMITALQGQVTSISSVPKGLIAMWSGSNASIPTGWKLCDGSNSTPNLRDRFIVGSGSSYTTGNTGGQDSITDVPSHVHSYSGSTSSTGSHKHSVSVNISTAGAHSHRVQQTNAGGSGDSNRRINDYTGGSPNYATSVDGSHTHNANVTVGSAGTHSHNYNGSTNSTGRSSVDIRPKYYALAFIMKA